MRHVSLVLPVLALVFGACTDASDKSFDEVEDVDGKADSSTFPYAAYVHDGAAGEELAELIMFPDHTYIRVGSFDYDSVRTRGTFTFTHWQDRRYIRFNYADSTFVDRYRYYVNGSVLKVRANPTSTSTGPYQPMFTAATGKDAWVRAIKLDWFDNWFDLDVNTWSQTQISPSELPAAAMPAYTDLTQFGALDVDVYKFTAHGTSGFLAYAFDTVMFFDTSGAVIATGNHSDDFFEFEWE